jgi:hypothetical protein
MGSQRRAWRAAGFSSDKKGLDDDVGTGRGGDDDGNDPDTYNVATYWREWKNMSIQISGPAIPPDGTVTAAKIASGNANDGQVLTADGAGAVAWETPAGGAVTGDAVVAALQVGANAGNARGVGAVDLQSTRGSPTQVASGKYSVIGGGLGNTASAHSSAVGGGLGNTASAPYSAVGGGRQNTASAPYSAVGGGRQNTASGYYSVVGGGKGNTASAPYSAVGGEQALAALHGQLAHASGKFAVAGDAQWSRLVARVETTSNTPTALALDGASTSLEIPDDTTWAFDILVAARRTDADNESAGYHFCGCVDRNTGTVALVGSVTKTVLAEDSAGWDCNLSADDTGKTLKITAMGENAKTIRWVARIDLTQVTG